MPKTNLQKIIFGLMMALVMVYGMEMYNSLMLNKLYLNFTIPLNEFLILLISVVVFEWLIAGPLARKLVFQIIKPQKPLSTICIFSSIMVCLMCPLMSFVATILFKCTNGIDSTIFIKWIDTTVTNFPMAFFWQSFIAGPLVRFIFRKLFMKSPINASV